MTDVAERDDAAELIALIDRFEQLLERSDLAELEVEAGGTVLRLAKPVAVVATVAAPTTAALPVSGSGVPVSAPADAPKSSPYHGIIAPLTGLFYSSPSPDAAPYLRVGGTVSKGQVIGLIEAMKLFNEIKSDVSGTVHSIVAESGALVKQKQTLVEVVPS
ncbi:MAG: biotin/lipoyl-containing protein [Candidatus Limnocylindrales bacterium]